MDEYYRSLMGQVMDLIEAGWDPDSRPVRNLADAMERWATRDQADWDAKDWADWYAERAEQAEDEGTRPWSASFWADWETGDETPAEAERNGSWPN